MKEIKAIIRPELLDAVMDALNKEGWNKMTVTDVLGRGAQGGIKFMSRGKTYNVDLLEKKQITIVCFDGKVDRIVEIILNNARTDRGAGDGKIFISECVKSIRINDGAIITESDSNAQDGL